MLYEKVKLQIPETVFKDVLMIFNVLHMSTSMLMHKNSHVTAYKFSYFI